MKLTTQQIATIDETLVLNGLIYDDIKLEVTDHIASEIEQKEYSEEDTFEILLKDVFEKWKPLLKNTTYGLLLGYAYSGPKIVMDKMADITKSEIKWGVVLSFFSALLIFLIYQINHNINFLIVLGIIIKRLLYIITLSIVFCRLFLLKIKCNTIYSALFNKRIYLLLLYTAAILFDFYPIAPLNKDLEIQIFSLIYPLLFVMFGSNNLRLFYKHYQLEKKLKVS